MINSKYLGRIYEGRWKVEEVNKYSDVSGKCQVVLRNIYNGETRIATTATLVRIERGETTLSKIASVKAHRYHRCMKRRKRYDLLRKQVDTN